MFGMTRIPDLRQTSQHVRKVPRMSIWQGSPHVIMTIASSGNSIKSAMSHLGQTEEISITNFFEVTAEKRTLLNTVGMSQRFSLQTCAAICAIIIAITIRKSQDRKHGTSDHQDRGGTATGSTYLAGGSQRRLRICLRHYAL